MGQYPLGLSGQSLELLYQGLDFGLWPLQDPRRQNCDVAKGRLMADHGLDPHLALLARPHEEHAGGHLGERVCRAAREREHGRASTARGASGLNRLGGFTRLGHGQDNGPGVEHGS